MAAGKDYYDDLVVLAVIVALLVNLFFLFRVVPWSKPGSWRRIWALAAVAALLFIVSEAAILPDNSITALDNPHQVPLFRPPLARAAGVFLAYAPGYRAAPRVRILPPTHQVTPTPNPGAA